MAWNELPKAWRADVGGQETGTKSWGEYHVQVEYIAYHPEIDNKKYYLRAEQWFEREEDAYNYLKNFKYGKIRQAWIDKVITVKKRVKYYDLPHNIESD